MADTKTEADAIFDAADAAALKYQAVKALKNIDRTLFSIALSAATLTFIAAGIGIELSRIAKAGR